MIPLVSFSPSAVRGHPSQFSLAPTFITLAAPSPATALCSAMGSLLPSPTRPKLTSVLPLWEVAGMDGLVRVHVAFSLTELSQIEKKYWDPILPIFPLSLKNSSTLPNLVTLPSMTFIWFLSTTFSQRSTGESRIRLVPMQTKSTKLMTSTQLGLGNSQSGPWIGLQNSRGHPS